MFRRVLFRSNENLRGSFLGIPDFPTSYSTIEKELHEETTLLLYSDCLTESRNLAGDELGVERLHDIFERAPNGTAAEILEFVIDIFDAFTEAVPLIDDLTILVLKYKN